MAKLVPVSQRKRGSKNKRGPKGNINRTETLSGYQRRVNYFPPSDTTYSPAGISRQRSFVFTTVGGNFVDPTNHAWRRKRKLTPNHRIDLDYQTNSKETWYGNHSFTAGCYYDMFSIDPYVNTDDSELCYAGSVKKLCERIAYSKFLKKMKNSELALAVDIAEGKKSIDMVRQRLVQVIDIARQVRRKAFHISRVNPNDPSKTPWAVIGNTWLEYQYGWKPLLGSAFGICDGIRNRSRAGKERIKGFHRISFPPTFLQKKSSLGITGFTERIVSTKATISCDFAMDNAFLRDASRFIGLNPLGIVWELVPYSFVADWFIDIGGYLEDFETSMGLGLTFKRGWRSYVHDVQHRITIPAQIASASGRSHYVYTGTASQEFRDKNRQVLSGVPKPDLPTFDPKFGAARIASGAALLLNILTKFNRRDRFDDRVKFDPWGPGWKYF